MELSYLIWDCLVWQAFQGPGGDCLQAGSWWSLVEAMVPLQEYSQEEGLCTICQEHLKEAVSTDCGHLFCQLCLALYLKEHVLKAVCPICRAPCSEKVLGEGYICQSHQERVSLFCEESCHLLCVKCRECAEHQSHQELTIEEAISHYKERLCRRIRKLKKDRAELQRLKAQEEEKLQTPQVGHENYRMEAELEGQHQTRGQLNAFPQQELDQLEDTPAEKATILDLSRAITQLSNLITDLERANKQLAANTLKHTRDLLNRSAPQKLEAIYTELERRVNGSASPPSSAALTSSSLGHIISDLPRSPLFPPPTPPSSPLGLLGASPGLPSPEHVPLSSSP